LRAIGSIVVFAALWLQASTSRAAGPRDELAISRARASKLWTDQAWLRLVHYRAGTLGGVKSEVDGARFFLSPEGRSNPRAELEATLRAFYRAYPGSVGSTTSRDSHARCRFPARFHFLDQKLGIGRELPAVRCPELARYRTSMKPESVALIYAANSLDSPVTAFGHTFLLFRRPKATDVAVEYTAETDTKNPVLYTFKGLFGLFPGKFLHHEAPAKLQYYLDEGRDLWEYDLALTKSETEQLTRHLWELSTTHFNYYYMSENCSYGVLSLLEGAIPRLELLEATNYVVPPVDTVRALFRSPGLVRAVRYRPAHSARQVPLEQKAPHLGHGSMRALLGTGFTSQNHDGFATLGYRIALHDLADPSPGQPALSQIQFMDIRLRYAAKSRRFTLNELTFAELFALHPIGIGFEPSWRVRARGMRIRDDGCPDEDCFAHGLDGSIGLSVATRDERVAAFAMADAFVLFSGELDGIGGSFVRAGVGPYAGLRIEALDPLLLVVSGSWSYLPGQSTDSTYELQGALRLSLLRDVALGFESFLQPNAIEAQLLSYLYF
jgi:hypothetical protein